MSPPLPATPIDPSAEGFISFTVDGETYQTWFKVFGDLGTSKRRPVVVVHGGPGMCHDYLLPLSDLAALPDPVPVIFYDQLGNARSTHLPDKPKQFWTIKLFMDELENLLRYFNIQDDFDLVGHSWGGMLGTEIEIQRHPSGLKHLVLANALASMADWDKSVGQLIQGLPVDVQQVLMAGPEKDKKKFLEASKVLEAKHACTVLPLPKEVAVALEVVYGEDGDMTVDRAMFEYELKDWTVVDQLHIIRTPTLVINGAGDMAQDFVVEPLVTKIPDSTWIRYEHSSHMPHWEEREKYMKDVEKFLRT